MRRDEGASLAAGLLLDRRSPRSARGFTAPATRIAPPSAGRARLRRGACATARCSLATRDTLVGAFGGLALGGAIGLALGVVLGLSRALDRLMELTVEAAAADPLGRGDPGRAGGARLRLSARDRHRRLRLRLADADPHARRRRRRRAAADRSRARAAPVRLRRRVSKIVAPAALPRIFVAFRLAAGVALIVAVTVEIAVNPQGLGAALMTAGQALRPDLMLAYLVWIGIVGFALNQGCCSRRRGCFGAERRDEGARLAPRQPRRARGARRAFGPRSRR